MSTNPYYPPDASSPNRDVSSVIGAVSKAGVAISLLFFLLYTAVVCVSAVEYLSTPASLFNDANGLRTTGYLRHGIVSSVFAAISFFAAIGFMARSPLARWLLIASPVLLMVFIFPGLNAIWNTVTRVLSP